MATQPQPPRQRRVLWILGGLALGGVALLIFAAMVLIGPLAEHRFRSLEYEYATLRDSARGLDSQQQSARRRAICEEMLQMAERAPDSPLALAGPLFVVGRGHDESLRRTATEKLLVEIDARPLAWLAQGFRYVPADSEPLARGLLARVSRELDHPQAAYLLGRVCSLSASNNETSEPPEAFVGAAQLLGERFAESPEIHTLCEVIAGGSHIVPWAAKYEPLLEKVLASNRDRWVKCTASMALARVAQSDPMRQELARSRFEAFMADFDGATPYVFQNLEQSYRSDAQFELEAMAYAPLLTVAPSLAGIALDGQPLDLETYRGRVVLLSFWATWCGPCMEMVELEKSLRDEYGAALQIIGVNSDREVDVALAAQKDHGIDWPSFRNYRPDQTSISDDWNAFFPTLVVIDAQGIIRQRFIGNPPRESITAAIDSAQSPVASQLADAARRAADL